MSTEDSVDQTTSMPSQSDVLNPATPSIHRAGLRVFLLSFAVYCAVFAVCLLLVRFILNRSPTLNTIVLELIYAAIFALSMAVLAWMKAYVIRSKQTAVQIAMIGVSLFFIVMPAFLVFSRYFLPDSGWNALPQPPETLSKIVTTTPIGVFGGEIYVSANKGAVYGFMCDDSGCAWKKVDMLPPSTDPRSYWSGTCRTGNESPLLWLEPPAPSPVLDHLVTTYCGPDYTIETHFLLTVDSKVWILQKWGGMEIIVYLFLGVPAALALAIFGAWFTGRIFRQGSVPPVPLPRLTQPYWARRHRPLRCQRRPHYAHNARHRPH